MTHKEVDNRFAKGINCPICGMQLIDLEHDGYESGDEHNHEYCCTNCYIEFSVQTHNYRSYND